MAEEQITTPAPVPEKVSGGSVEDLPKSMVRRLVKDKLGDISVLREALDAFSESSRIFIHYLSAAANDICKESNRQTINAEDVFKALDDIEFSEFVGPLRASLEDFRQKNSVKRSGSSKVKEAKKSEKEIPTKDRTEEEQNSDEGNEKSTKEIPMENGTEEENMDEGNEDPDEASAHNDTETS
ncbi:DNA polymerase II subunit B4-like [Apium graveolens]|uniref:DNA polymerase II subunit B4-like n=1 Tax=Apium graveolens TaxID=4045 RepID=UPI003D7A2445